MQPDDDQSINNLFSQNSVSLESGDAPHAMYSGESVVKSATGLTEDYPYLAF